MTKIVLVVLWVVVGVCGPCPGAPPEAGVWVTLESVDGRTLDVEVLDIAGREVEARTAGGKALTIRFELLSQTSQAVLEQLDGSEAWLARRFPMAWKVRSDQAAREARIAKLGGDAKSEGAVLNALRYLQKVQNRDGSWDTRKVAYTGLALQCFSGRGFSPLSEEFGECYTAGLVYLIDIAMKNHGRLADDLKAKHWPYEHAIATEALVEGWMICSLLEINMPNLEQAATNATQWIIDNQHKSGGWEYAYDESGSRGGDLSITSWHISALHAARVANLEVRNVGPCLSKAREYVVRRQGDDGGFWYVNPPVSGSDRISTLTGAGVRCLQVCDLAKGVLVISPEERNGMRYLGKHLPFDWKTRGNLYALYHESRALARRGGPTWIAYHHKWRDDFLLNQNADGSWPKPATDKWSTGPIHTTCLVTLILESYYR